MPLKIYPNKIKKRKSDGTYEAVAPGVISAVDSQLSTTSASPVQNKVVTNALNAKVDKSDYSPVGKTSEMTIPVGKDANGRLWTVTPTIPEEIASVTSDWLEENVTQETGYVLDRSLQIENAAAPADMVGDLKNALNHKADIIYDTASGDIASFPDGADGLPVKDLTVAIEPVQSGTGDPSPTNVRPISGWTGANVANISDGEKQPYFAGLINGTYGFVDLGTLNWEKTNTSSGNWRFQALLQTAKSAVNSSIPSKLVCAKYLPISPDATWLGSTGITVNNSSRYILVCDMAYTDAATFKTAMSGVYLIYELYTPTTPTITQAQYNTLLQSFNLGGWLVPISWQSEAGTVYAASLDALAGSLKVRPYYVSYNGETLVGPWVSSMDVYTPGGTPTTGAQVVDFGGSETLYSLDSIALNTLLGQNNIWTDCGPVSVEYPCDTKLYIQKINTPTDDDMIADAQIASGKYFIVNNNLYISTAAILAGDPIKPGTNCTLTNLAAALNALNS